MKNKIVIITGAASGIGLATSHIFSEKGSIVVMADINKVQLDKAGKDVSKYGSEVLTIHVDVRILTATNKDLWCEIDSGNFRNDLYYRLYVYPITIPPLRNRVEDIPELIDMKSLFVEKLWEKLRPDFLL